MNHKPALWPANSHELRPSRFPSGSASAGAHACGACSRSGDSPRQWQRRQRRHRAARPGLSRRPPAREALAAVLPFRLAAGGDRLPVCGLRAAPGHGRSQRPAYGADRCARRDRGRWRIECRERDLRLAQCLRGCRLAGGGAAHQFARWQPGAGRPHQRRGKAAQGQARQEALRRLRGDVRLGAPSTSRWRPTRCSWTRLRWSARSAC